MDTRTTPPQKDDHASLIVTLLTLYALLVHGFHPYVEDGGVYIAGIKKLLDPALYPAWSQFVTEHLRFSVFAPTLAGLTRVSHLSLPWVLFLLYLATVWLTLRAAWMLIARATPSLPARAGATSLLAAWITLPIAGTSLMLMDPYLTARSFSTPLALLALVLALDAVSQPHQRTRNALLCAIAILLAAVLHPLMAGYAAAAVAILIIAASRNPAIRRFGPLALLAIALLTAAALHFKAPQESPDYVRIAMTRYYWFPFRWEWYEQLGLIAPLLLLFFLGRTRQHTENWTALTRTALLLGAISLTVAIAFSRAGLATHLVARMQPLRCYQLVYELMILLLGAWLGEHLLKRNPWRWTALLLAFGALMFYVQRSTFPASDHLEFPGRTPSNPWVQAFLWSRDHTPKDALFALDAHYITRGHSEDAQTFRAIAERSALPDYSKDGGEASITPNLTTAWVLGQSAQTGLETMTDSQRLAALTPFQVTWAILETPSPTNWLCPYRNAIVKVCQLPRTNTSSSFPAAGLIQPVTLR